MFDFNMGDIFDTIGDIANAWDTYNQYSRKADAYESDADVSTSNMALELQKSQDAKDRGAERVMRIQEGYRGLEGKQKAAMGASGVVVGEGTFSNILADTKTQGQQDAETEWENALREAYGHDIAAQNDFRRATANRQAADDTEDSGWWAGLGSLASGFFE